MPRFCRLSCALAILMIFHSAVAAQVINGAPIFRNHEVPNGTAQEMADLLNTKIKNPNVRIAVSSNYRLFVYASPAMHDEIASLLRGLMMGPLEPIETMTIFLKHADPEKLGRFVRGVFLWNDEDVKVDLQRKALVLRGTTRHLKTVVIMIRSFD